MEGMEKMRESVICFWLCSLAEHIKLGSNPSSQYLPYLVCCYILYFFMHNTHTNIINRWMAPKTAQIDFILFVMRLTQQSLPKERIKNYGRFGWILWSLQLKGMPLMCFFILQAYFKSFRPSLRFAWFRRLRPIYPSSTPINNNLHSPIHPTKRRSTQSIKSIQQSKKKEWQWDTHRYSH